MEQNYTHVLIHAGLYRRVNGTLQPLVPGTRLCLSKSQGEDMVRRGLVKAIDPMPVEKTSQEQGQEEKAPVTEDQKGKKQQRKRQTKK